MTEHMPKQCPLCGAAVSQSRFAELQAQIHEEERRKLEDAMRVAREELDRAHREDLEAQGAAHRQDAAAREAQREKELAAERERLASAFEDRFQQGVARAVADATVALETGLRAANGEAIELRGVVTDLQATVASASATRQIEIDAAIADTERRHGEQVAAMTSNAAAQTKEQQRLESVIAALEAKWHALAETKEAEVNAAVAETTRLHQLELAKQRTTLEKDRDDQVRRAKNQHVEDDQKVQKRVADLQRQLEKKTADDLGHWAEVDLYEAVQEEFKDDRVSRVAKGEPGADIVLEVMQRGESCGKIVIDSKNRKQWQDRYAEKLAQDRVDSKAEHAVLATNVFPAGAKDLCLRTGGVIVTRPLSVVPLLRILRTALVNNHVRRLSARQREEKAARLYEYINGPDFRQTLASANRAFEQLEELDVTEKRDHENLWHKRGKLERDIVKALGNAESRVNEIIEGSGEEAVAIGAPRSA